MKKRIPVLALAIVLSIVFCATALAIASRAGMLDYENLFYNTYLPENAAEFIEQDVHTTANDLVDISIRELYYDGRTSRITVDVKTKDESVLLVGIDTCADDAWANLHWMNPEFDESDTRSVAEVFKQDGYTASYSVDIRLIDADGESFGSSEDCFYTEPGVLTFFQETNYISDLSDRTASFRVTLDPFLASEDNQIDHADDQEIYMEELLKLSSSAAKETVYVSTEPVVIEEAGVTVDQMQLYVKPHELYVKLYYTLPSELETLAFEFIDPSIVTDEPSEQRLMEGPTGHIITRHITNPGTGMMKMALECTLGLNELTDSYTVRIYDYSSKERRGSAVITMREATEAEIAAFPAE